MINEMKQHILMYSVDSYFTFFTRNSRSWWKSRKVDDTKIRTVFHPHRFTISFFSMPPIFLDSTVFHASSHCRLMSTYIGSVKTSTAFEFDAPQPILMQQTRHISEA